MLIRYCPRCRSEFQRHVSACLDCGGPTEDRDDEFLPAESDEVPVAPVEEEDDLDEDEDLEEGETKPSRRRLTIPPGTQLLLVRQGPYSDITDLAEALARREIPHNVVEHLESEGRRFGLVIGVENQEIFAEIDREVYLAGLREEIPEVREGVCPACGTNLSPGDLECRECGLILTIVEEAEESEESEPGPP